MKILVTSDSTCALERKEAEKIGLPILPLNVIANGVEYHDGVDIFPDQLNQLMRGGAVIKTSTPTPYEIETFFDEQFAKGVDHIIHFTISSKLSSMFDLFTHFCQDKYGEKVTVIDSRSVCTYMLNHVLAAKHLAEQGKSVDEIKAALQKRISSEEIFFLPESLTYLKNGGRISPAVALIGNLIGMKPVLALQDGAIEKKGTTRNVKKEIEEQLKSFAKKGCDPKQWEVHIVVFDTDPKLVDYTTHKIHELLPGFEVQCTPISINVCAHAGPGTIGVGIVLKPE